MNSPLAAQAVSRHATGQHVAWSPVLTPGVLAAFLTVIVVLIATLAVGLKNLRSLYDASGAVVHTHEVTAGLEQLLLPAVDAETGERGFIITGTDNYLEPYERARNQMASVLARVRALTATDPNIRRTWIACPR